MVAKGLFAASISLLPVSVSIDSTGTETLT